jgi:sterol desaturase/sphingolipid hydroxylase (fatty acid hydroxylase superfamily)
MCYAPIVEAPVLLAIPLGAFAWTLTEYTLHRFVGHGRSRRAAFAREHQEHHRQRLYFAPWSSKLSLAVLVVGGLAVVVLPLAGPTAFAFLLSYVASWLLYEAIHRDLHVRAPRTALGRFLRRHHMHHHHVDPRTNHGVTSPLWDAAFRTLRPSARVRVPAAKAPDWLLHAPPDADFRDAYEIVGAEPPTPRG